MAAAITEDYGWDDADALDSSNYITPAILQIVKLAGAKTVLDIGCGNGALCGDLAKADFAVVGVDGDERGIALARERYKGAHFEVMRFDDDPLPLVPVQGTAFDCCVSTEVIEHLYAPHEMLEFAFRALRPGGKLILSTPYHGYLKNMALSLTNKWDDHFTPLWYGGHIKFWSRRTLTALLEANGFRVIGFDGVGRLPMLWKSMILTAERV